LLIDGTDNFRRTRYYNTDGYLTRRSTHEDFVGTVYDPETSRTLQTTQIADFTDTLAVPGDLDSATFQQTGVVKFFLPGAGVLLRDVGREVVGPGGDDLGQSGQHQLNAYFDGAHSVLARLCAALGSPGAISRASHAIVFQIMFQNISGRLGLEALPRIPDLYLKD
jgi:hypothetical protein